MPSGAINLASLVPPAVECFGFIPVTLCIALSIFLTIFVSVSVLNGYEPCVSFNSKSNPSKFFSTNSLTSSRLRTKALHQQVENSLK